MDDGHHGHENARWSGIRGLAYSLIHISPPTNRVVVERAALGPDDRTLDVGCGAGAAVVMAARTTASATGLDPSPSLLRVARIRRLASGARDRITFEQGTAEHLPLPDGSVTVAWSINSLHHWDDPHAGLVEVFRALAPGGRILIAEDEAVHAPGSKKAHRGRHVVASQVEDWLSDAGFTQIAAERNVLDDLAIVTGVRPS